MGPMKDNELWLKIKRPCEKSGRTKRALLHSAQTLNLVLPPLPPPRSIQGHSYIATLAP